MTSAEIVGLPSQYVPPAKPPPAPRGLGASGRKLWRSMVADYEFDPDDMALLREACSVTDRIAAIEAELEGAPLTVSGSRGQDMPNPLLREVRAERTLLVKLLDRLEPPAREGEWDNLNASQRARKAARARWS